MIFQDIHNHLADPRLENNLAQVIVELKKLKNYSCVVNGTNPKDWPRVEKLTKKHPNICYSAYGLHPWYVNEYYDSDWLTDLECLISSDTQAGIGECGLDKWIPNHNVELQQNVFETHLKLAKKYQRPVYIHCLKAWELLVSILQKTQLQPKTFLIHAFSGSAEVAAQLLKLGAMFSFSGYFLHTKKKKTVKLYQELPLQNVLIETDSPSMPLPERLRKHELADDSEGARSHPANIEVTFASFMELRKESKDEIAQTLFNNYQSLVGFNS